MDRIRIRGGRPLSGEIAIGGAKNAALPLMAAGLLTDERLVLENVPRLADIETMRELLAQHGIAVEPADNDGRTLSLGGAITNITAAVNHPARVAERIATPDHLSEGRVEFGTGRGSSSAEWGGFVIPSAAETKPQCPP